MRVITLSQDHTFQASDRVSPCPPNVACVWSGIVERSGSWKLSGKTLTLEPSGEPQKAGVPLPTTLAFERNALSETSNGNDCVYTRR